jgi:hypothetical protein
MRSRTIRYWTISGMIGYLLAGLGGAQAFAQQPTTHDLLASLPEARGSEAQHLRVMLESAQTATTLAEPSDSLALEGKQLVEGLFHGYQEGTWVEAYADLYSETTTVPHAQGIVVIEQLQHTTLPEPDTSAAIYTPASLPASDGGEPAQALAVSARMVNFGMVNVHEYAEVSLTIQNISQRELHGTVHVQAPYLVVSGGTFTLALGEAQEVTLRFSPERSGIYLANATINSDEGTTTIGLRGIAQAHSKATRTTYGAR